MSRVDGSSGAHPEAVVEDRPSAVIEARGLFKGFGAVLVLDGLDFAIERGRVCALLGRNGSGKTTLIRILLGLIERDAGACSILGHDPRRDAAAIREKVGFVSEDLGFYPWMKVDEHLDFVGRFHEKWDSDHVSTLVKKLDLPRGARVRDLSRGVRGKLALVAALGHRPELLLLDEPMAGLDPVVRRQFLSETIELLAEQERTVLLVTHMITDVEKIADAVAILHGGRIVLSGDLESVKGRYARLRAVFADSPPPGIESLGLSPARLGQELSLVVSQPVGPTEERLVRMGARQVEVTGLSLEELFCALTA